MFDLDPGETRGLGRVVAEGQVSAGAGFRQRPPKLLARDGHAGEAIVEKLQLPPRAQ